VPLFVSLSASRSVIFYLDQFNRRRGTDGRRRAPWGLKVLRARIQSLEQQRQLLARRMTRREAGAAVPLSDVLATYEQLETSK
jgi:hypothetical protein